MANELIIAGLGYLVLKAMAKKKPPEAPPKPKPPEVPKAEVPGVKPPPAPKVEVPEVEAKPEASAVDVAAPSGDPAAVEAAKAYDEAKKKKDEAVEKVKQTPPEERTSEMIQEMGKAQAEASQAARNTEVGSEMVATQSVTGTEPQTGIDTLVEAKQEGRESAQVEGGNPAENLAGLKAMTAANLAAMEAGKPKPYP